MSSKEVVRSYQQKNIHNGGLFDAGYVDHMETGIENSFIYSNYLEEKMLPQMGMLDSSIDINQVLTPGIYELANSTNPNLPLSEAVSGSLLVFAGTNPVQIIIGSNNDGEIVKSYFRKYLDEQNFTDWITFDIEGAADFALQNSKDYTDEEIKKVQDKVIPETIKNTTITIDQLTAGTNNTTIPSSLLPSYVDDVIEVENYNALIMLDGERNKIYVTTNDNKTYRWTGSEHNYVEISKSIALGTTSETAYYGDKGAAAYNHSQNKGISLNSGLYKISTNSEGHVTAGTQVTKEDITNLGFTDNITYEIVNQNADGLAPKLSNQYGKLANQDADYILANKNNVVGWYTLPNAAYNSVSATSELTEGILIGTITTNNETINLYAPENNIDGGFLPITGGTITGEIFIKNDTNTKIGFLNSSNENQGTITINDNGALALINQGTRDEYYILPSPNTDGTDTKNYSILTTRDTITLEQGGTGATDRAAASINLLKMSNNIINSTTDDTSANWSSLGFGSSFYTKASQLNNQPSTYGILTNLGVGTEIFQLWHTQPNGNVFWRGGNADNGLSSWYTILDTNNYSQYALPKTGGTLNGNLTIAGETKTLNITNGAITVTGSDNTILIPTGNKLKTYQLYLGDVYLFTNTNNDLVGRLGSAAEGSSPHFFTFKGTDGRLYLDEDKVLCESDFENQLSTYKVLNANNFASYAMRARPVGIDFSVPASLNTNHGGFIAFHHGDAAEFTSRIVEESKGVLNINQVKATSTLGTTSTVGISRIIIGNDNAEGENANAYGQITLYGRGTQCYHIEALYPGDTLNTPKIIYVSRIPQVEWIASTKTLNITSG